MNLHSKGKGIDNSTVQNESQPLEMHSSVHHPHCSAHYEFGTILNDCICDEFRASYERGIQHGLWLAEAAVEAIDRFDWIPPTYAKTKVVAAIRALKEKP